MRVLVVGASGDLGSRVCLALQGHDADVEVHGSVRDRARAPDLAAQGVELVEADLTSPEGLARVLPGTDVVVVSANAVVPRRGDDPRQVEAGLLRLVDDAARVGVRRVVLVSLPVSRVDDKVPFVRARRALERRVVEAVAEPGVLRFPPFMSCWLSLVGSSIPLRGSPHGTIGRPSPFLQSFRRVSATLVEDRGVMLVPGPSVSRNAFISEADVAEEVALAALAPAAPGAPVEIGGPEVLTWRQVADTYGDLLGRRVRIVSTPAGVYAALGVALRPLGVVPSATMALDRFVASVETVWPPGGGQLDPARLTTVRDYLAAKLGMSPVLPQVP